MSEQKPQASQSFEQRPAGAGFAVKLTRAMGSAAGAAFAPGLRRAVVLFAALALLMHSLIPLLAFEAHVVNVTAELKPRCETFEVRSMGYWKTHPEDRIFSQTVGGESVDDSAEADAMFALPDNVMRNKLKKQLLALKFNLALFGSGEASVPNENITLDELADQADALVQNMAATNAQLQAMKNRVEAVNTNEGGTQVLALNAGGPEYLGTDGITYLADQYYTGGTTYGNAVDIENTDDDALYQTERWGDDLSYHIPVPAGEQKVTLKFAEIFWQEAGQRLFDVKAEGVTVITYLDIYQAAGGFARAYDVLVTAQVMDGVLDLEFKSISNSAKLSALIVTTQVPGGVVRCDKPLVLINKVYYDVGKKKGAENDNEWAELYNKTEVPLDVSGWKICDGQACDTVPNNTPPIPSFGFAVVTSKPTTWDFWSVPPGVVKIVLNSAIGNGLSNSADMVSVRRPDGLIVDQMNYGTPDTGWLNWNAQGWNPGVPDSPEGTALTRKPTGFDTDQPSDWVTLAMPVVTIVYPDPSVLVWGWGETFDILWTAANPNGPAADLKIDILYLQDENQNHVIDAGDSTMVVASQTENDGVHTFTTPFGFVGDVWIRIIATGPENVMAQGVATTQPVYDPPLWMLEEMPQIVLERLQMLPADGCSNAHEIVPELSLDAADGAEKQAEAEHISEALEQAEASGASPEAVAEEAETWAQSLEQEALVEVEETVAKCVPAEEPVVEEPVSDDSDDVPEEEPAETPADTEAPMSGTGTGEQAEVVDNTEQPAAPAEGNAEAIGGDVDVQVEPAETTEPATAESVPADEPAEEPAGEPAPAEQPAEPAVPAPVAPEPEAAGDSSAVEPPAEPAPEPAP